MLLICALCAFVTAAAETNLVRNTGFFGDGFDGICNWRICDRQKDVCTLLPGAGPDGADAVRVDIRSGRRFSQDGARLVAGERYRFGVWVRTKGLGEKSVRFLLWNAYWNKSISVAHLPADTHGEWRELSCEGVMVPSENGCHNFGFYVDDPKTCVPFEVARPYLIPLTERACEKSVPAAEELPTVSRIVPVAPRLSEVDCRTGEMSFYYPSLSGGLTLEATVDGGPVRAAPLDARGRAKVAFGTLATGDHDVQVRIVRGGKTVAENGYPIVAVRPLPRTGRRLNNFVTEYLRTDAAPGTFAFDNPRDGWVYLSVAEAGADAKGFLDDGTDPVLVVRPGERFETMRDLKAGRHVLRLAGSVGGTLRVHGVLTYALSCCDAFTRPSDPYSFQFGGDWFRRNAVGCINTAGGHYAPPNPDSEAEFRARGIHVSGTFNAGADTPVWSERGRLARELAASWPVRKGCRFSLDETAINLPRQTQWNVAEALWPLCTKPWQISVFVADAGDYVFRDPLVQTSEIAAIVNTGRGRGLLASETYLSTLPTEAATIAQEDHYAELIRSMQEKVPVSPSGLLLYLGAYIEPGGWNLYATRDADIKAMYDHALHRFATDPAFAEVSAIGFSALVHADEEIARWIVRLWRYYGLDGGTEPLAPVYGFTYRPGHLKDCDFVRGFADWRAEPAEADSLRPITVKGYGTVTQARKGVPKGFGDTAALFVKSAQGANRLSAKLTGLKPGRLYAVSYYVSDYEEVLETEKTVAIARPIPGLSAEIKGGELWTERRTRRRNEKKSKYARTCSFVDVFRATASEATLTFTDAAVAPGMKVLLNGVCVRPYFEDREVR